MVKKKIKVQSLVFDKKFFGSKASVRAWVNKNGFIIDKRLKRPILKYTNSFRVRQKSPDVFDKKTFKCESLGKGVKGVYGRIKKK